jgi:hypothetical protein
MGLLFSAWVRARASGGTQILSAGVASRQTYGYTHCSQPYSSRQHSGLDPHMSAGLAHVDTQERPLQLAVSLIWAGWQTSST